MTRKRGAVRRKGRFDPSRKHSGQSFGPAREARDASSHAVTRSAMVWLLYTSTAMGKAPRTPSSITLHHNARVQALMKKAHRCLQVILDFGDAQWLCCFGGPADGHPAVENRRIKVVVLNHAPLNFVDGNRQ